MSKFPTRWSHHTLPLLKQCGLKAVAWTETVRFVSRHKLLHRLQYHAQLQPTKSNLRCSTCMPYRSLWTMACPKFAPKSTHSRGRIPKPRYLPHAWTRPTYGAKRHLDLIHRFSTMHWTDRSTDASTYVRMELQIVHGKV